MFSHLLMMAVLAVMASAITVDDCPPGLKRDKFLTVYGNKCYRFEVSKLKDFNDALNYCHNKGGKLASVKTKEVNNFIHNKLNGTYGFQSSHFWIGLHYNYNLNRYSWVDGTGLQYTNFKNEEFYGSDSDYCIAMNAGTGFWEHDECEDNSMLGNDDKTQRFICEYSPSVSTKYCPSNLKRDKYLKSFGNTCYRFVTYSSKGFQKAQDYCEQGGGNLAIVKSKATNDFIQKKLKSFGYKLNSFWIGLKYNSIEGNFVWMDGTPLKRGNFKSKTIDDTNECVAIIAGSGLWQIYRCHSLTVFGSERNGFVCQYLKMQPSTSAPITKQDCPITVTNEKSLQVFGHKCYYFDLQKTLSFQQAENSCRKFGGTLAMIKSNEINNFIKHHLQNTHGLDFSSGDMWIGLSYNSTHKSYQWTDGTPMQFRNFEMPDARTNECAAMVPWDGQWTDLECSAIKHFICELEAKTTQETTTRLPLITTITSKSTFIPTTATKQRNTTIYKTTEMPATTTIATNNSMLPTITMPSTNNPTISTMPRNTTMPTNGSIPPATTMQETTIMSTVISTMPSLIPATIDRNTMKQTTQISPESTSSPPPPPTTPIIPETATMSQTNITTEGCPSLVCDLDCDFNGYIKNSVTGCMECKCND